MAERPSNSFKPLRTSLGDPFDDQRRPDPLTRELQRRPKRRPSWLRRGFRIACMTALACTVAGMIGGGLWLHELGMFNVDEHQFDIITKLKPVDNSVVFDRDGRKIGEYFNAYQVHVPFERLPEHLINAIIAIEDRSFWTHPGFDLRGIMRAGVARLRRQDLVQGGSTLTQQVVRHFLLPRERTFQRKAQELVLAYQLEQRISKERILEIYANKLFLGNGSYGVGAAAFRYFGKSVHELAPHESALIAGLFQSPSAYNPARHPKRAKRRQIQVIKAMYRAGMINMATAKSMMRAKLEYKEYKPLNTEFAPYFIDYVRDKVRRLLEDRKITVDGQGLRIYTTLSTDLQRRAEASVAESGKLLDDAQSRTAAVRRRDGKPLRATLETAILSTDPRTGEILAMVGGRDYRRTKFNRTWQAHRSPGSAFKPIVYSLALSQQWKWSDVIFVSPITIHNYRPRTPDDDYLTETTLLRAFYRSMNTPTVELGQKLGLASVLEHARRLGIKSPIKEEFGSMLGSSEVTMMDLARLYGTFANGGIVYDPIAIIRITDRAGRVLYEVPPREQRATQAITPQLAFLMTQGMRAVLAMGTGYRSAHLARFAAGKTGTSNDSTDNWFCGYSSNLTSIVWVGTDEHARIHGDVTGGKLALPIWDKFMTKAFEVRPPALFETPPGIVTSVVHPQYGHRSATGVRMYFLRGQEPTTSTSALEALSQSQESSYREIFVH